MQHTNKPQRTRRVRKSVSESSKGGPVHITEKDLELMEDAIEAAKLSQSEDKREHPLVGAVVVTRSGKTVMAHRGENRNGAHAEYMAIDVKLKSEDLSEAVVYTTLEPCTTRQHPKVPCVERIIGSRVKKVWIGMLDPNPDIWGQGVRALDNAHIAYDFFPERLRHRIWALNEAFIKSYVPSAHVRIPYYVPGVLEDPAYFTRKHCGDVLWGSLRNRRALRESHENIRSSPIR
jgi:pyrimidine deaminase RibD-like protein